MEKLTSNCHYNPCFWTAYWSKDGYIPTIGNGPVTKKNKARNQLVYRLNLKTHEIRIDKVDNIFKTKDLYTAEIDKNSLLSLLQKFNDISGYQQVKNMEGNPFLLSIENRFTAVESIYRSTINRIIEDEDIKEPHDKYHLAHFMLLQAVRNPWTFAYFKENYSQKGLEKFHFFEDFIKLLISDHFFEMVLETMRGRWTLYKHKSAVLPLGDTPFVIDEERTLFAVSPKILLEIDFSSPSEARSRCLLSDGIPSELYSEYIFKMLFVSEFNMISSYRSILEDLKNNEGYEVYRSKSNIDKNPFG